VSATAGVAAATDGRDGFGCEILAIVSSSASAVLASDPRVQAAYLGGGIDDDD
jgi:precorrin-6B methylase 2